MDLGRKLSTYRSKRRFDVTPEPKGERIAGGKARRPLVYTMQKHMASHLHYDLRLEWAGVLLSWAIPKGPSLDPGAKRLAMQTEDHPIEYAEFEGVIPRGEYGAGTVMLWDRGHWTPEVDNVEGALEKGDLKFTIEGEKLRGSWVLVHTHGYGGDPRRKSWLLIKHRDRFASTSDVTKKEPRSVKSGRLLAGIARDEGGDVQRAAEGDPAAGTRAPRAARAAPGAKRAGTAKRARGIRE